MEEHNITPIFIMGAYRSGTTMLASHLAENSQAIALPEMPFILDIVESTAESTDEIKKLYAKITKQFHYQASGITISAEKFIQLFKTSATPAQRVYKILQHHFNFSEKEKRYWIEHTPHNRERVELYLKVFPHAKFIHIVRDPRAVYSSMHNFIRWNTQDPIAFSKKWLTAITFGHLAASQHPETITEVSYEQYLKNQTTTLKDLCRFTGLTYDVAMNTGNGIQLPQYTLKQHQLVGKAPDITRMNAWQTAITLRESEIIEHECKAWMQYYDMSPISDNTRPITLIETIRFKIKQRANIPMSKIKRFRDYLITSKK